MSASRSLVPFYLEQIRAAELIVLNRIDLVDARQLNATLNRLAALNPRAAVIPTQHGDLDRELLFAGGNRLSAPLTSDAHVHA